MASSEDVDFHLAYSFVVSRTSCALPKDEEYNQFVPLPSAFIKHALEPGANNPGFLKKRFVDQWHCCTDSRWTSVSSMASATLYTVTLVFGGLTFVSQEWLSAQLLLTVDIKACASPFIAALSNYSRANCVADQLVSCASDFAGTNPDFATTPLALTYRQTRSNVGFTTMLVASAALLAAELIYLQASIARRQQLAARILPYYAYLKHVRLPCAVEPWHEKRGGGQCCACCCRRVRCNRWCGLWCCGRSVPLTTVMPQLVLTACVFLAYYFFKTLSVYNIVTQNAFQSVVETVVFQGSKLTVNTVHCTLANGTTRAPLKLLLDINGATKTLLGGGTLVFSIFPQVFFAIMLVLLAFVPQLISIYTEDGDVLAGVPLRGFVHCLEAKVGTECGHHELLARPDARHNPGLLAIGARGAAPAVLEPARFFAVEEALIDEVLWDLLAARGGDGGACGACARRRHFFSWPASGDRDEEDRVKARGEDVRVKADEVLLPSTGEVLLEAALRTAHADDPVDDNYGRIQALVRGIPSKEERIRQLARTLQATLRSRPTSAKSLDAAEAEVPQAVAAAVQNPLDAARWPILPPGWSEMRDGQDVWYAHIDGRTRWEKP
jgi:hypothetical protein